MGRLATNVSCEGQLLDAVCQRNEEFWPRSLRLGRKQALNTWSNASLLLFEKTLASKIYNLRDNKNHVKYIRQPYTPAWKKTHNEMFSEVAETPSNE